MRNPILTTSLLLLCLPSLVIAAEVTLPELELRQPAPPAAALAERLHRWHHGWSREMVPVREALARVLGQLADSSGPSELELPCRHLWRTLRGLDEERLFPVPDFAADRHLQAAVGHLGQAAIACLERRPSALIYQIDEAERALGNAALALRRYGLAP